MVLRKCHIIVPPSILEEMTLKDQERLSKFQLKVLPLEDEERQRAGKFLQLLTGKKEVRAKYLEKSNLRKIPHIGESEAAAIARQQKKPFDLLEAKASTVLKKALKMANVEIMNLVQLGEHVLQGPELKAYKNKLWEKLHIRSL